MGPIELPAGQVFGLIGGSLGPDGTYVTSPVTFSGSPPRVIFYPNGSTNEEGLVFVMSNADFRAQKKGAEQMLAVRRSTGTRHSRAADIQLISIFERRSLCG